MALLLNVIMKEQMSTIPEENSNVGSMLHQLDLNSHHGANVAFFFSSNSTCMQVHSFTFPNRRLIL